MIYLVHPCSIIFLVRHIWATYERDSLPDVFYPMFRWNGPSIKAPLFLIRQPPWPEAFPAGCGTRMQNETSLSWHRRWSPFQVMYQHSGPSWNSLAHINKEHCPLPKNTELMLKCLIWIQSDSVWLILIHFVGDCVLLTALCNSWQVAAANVGPFTSFWSGRPVTSAVTGCKHLVTVGYWLHVRRCEANYCCKVKLFQRRSRFETLPDVQSKNTAQSQHLCSIESNSYATRIFMSLSPTHHIHEDILV